MENVKIVMNQVELEYKKQMKYLGVILETRLKNRITLNCNASGL